MPTPVLRGPRWPPPRRGDILAVALLGAIVVALLVVGVRKPSLLSLDGASRGFGPDMECSSVGSGDPVCVRKSGLPRQ
jgi:hypothetical protein